MDTNRVKDDRPAVGLQDLFFELRSQIRLAAAVATHHGDLLRGHAERYVQTFSQVYEFLFSVHIVPICAFAQSSSRLSTSAPVGLQLLLLSPSAWQLGAPA